MFNSAKIHGLYAITPDLEDTDQLCKMVEASILGGARVIQYRNKVAKEPQRIVQARALQAICLQHQIPLIINDHIALCLELGAAGVHIGGGDGDIAAAKAEIGYVETPDNITKYGEAMKAQGLPWCGDRKSVV